MHHCDYVSCHMNPLLKVLGESQARFLAAWKALDLVFDDVMDAEQ